MNHNSNFKRAVIYEKAIIELWRERCHHILRLVVSHVVPRRWREVEKENRKMYKKGWWYREEAKLFSLFLAKGALLRSINTIENTPGNLGCRMKGPVRDIPRICVEARISTSARYPSFHSLFRLHSLPRRDPWIITKISNIRLVKRKTIKMVRWSIQLLYMSMTSEEI